MKAIRSQRAFAQLDPGILLLVVAIVGIGLVMICSASYPLEQDNPYHYLKRQAVWVAAGLIIMMLIARTNLEAFNSTWFLGLLLGASFLSLVLVFVPGVCAPANGAHRWLRIGSQTFQPSEFTKGLLVLFFAHYLAQTGDGIQRFVRGVLPMTVVTLVFIGLILLEKDLGSSVMVALLMMFMLFLGGAKKRVLAVYSLLGMTALGALIYTVPYQRQRIFSFLHPWDDPTGAGYQIKNSLVALGRGGIDGVGIGNGFQKLHYLPEIHTDFVLANLGEEKGLLGLLVVFGLFAVLVFRSLQVSMRHENDFVRLAGVGAATLLCLQVLVNAGVVMCLLPTTGLALPFISYGGSSALLNFGLIGLILSAGRTGATRAVRNKTVTYVPGRGRKAASLEGKCLDARNTFTS